MDIYYIFIHTPIEAQIYIYIYIYICRSSRFKATPLWHVSIEFDMPPTTWSWYDMIYIYNKKKEKPYKFEEVKISWNQVKFLKLGWRTLNDKKSSLKKFKSSFLTIIPFIQNIYIYRDDKLEENWKCKTRRKMNLKDDLKYKARKWSEVWKKNEKEIFKRKNRNFLLKYASWSLPLKKI